MIFVIPPLFVKNIGKFHSETSGVRWRQPPRALYINELPIFHTLVYMKVIVYICACTLLNLQINMSATPNLCVDLFSQMRTLLANFTSSPQHQQWNAQVNDELLSSGLIFGGCYGVKFLPSEQNNAIA